MRLRRALFSALLVLGLYPAQQALAVIPGLDECVAVEGNVYTVSLLAGQSIEAGDVSVEVVDDGLVVSYATSGGWELAEMHLWVGDSLASMPATRSGNPRVGLFPYHATPGPHTTYFSFTIPLETLGFFCPAEDKVLYLAAHASLSKERSDGSTKWETAWANGPRITEKGNWATYFTVVLSCCEEHEKEIFLTNCQTAFAFHAMEPGFCFLDFDGDGDGVGDFDRWGWSVGPLAPSSEPHLLPIYAGAGLCDLGKGVPVGWLSVAYDGSEAIVYYTLDDGYALKESQLYVGLEALPRDTTGAFTVAPGQYPFIHEDLFGHVTDVFKVTGFSFETISIVAHAVVCEVVPEEPGM